MLFFQFFTYLFILLVECHQIKSAHLLLMEFLITGYVSNAYIVISLPFNPAPLSLSLPFLFTPSVPSPIPPKLRAFPPVASFSVKVNCFLRFCFFFPVSLSCRLFD